MTPLHYKMMRHVISSGWTFVFKLVVPPVLVIISAFLMLTTFCIPGQPHSDALIGTLMVVGAAICFCWWGAKLKRVSVNRHNLYVASPIKEISIPFKGIYSISALNGGWPVVIRLKEKSEFGNTIFFLAEWRPLLFGSPHPILEELRQLITEAE